MLPDSTHPLSQADLTRLDQFLHSAACGQEAMGLSYAHGFLTAVASGPEQLEPSEWLRLMFDEPVFDTGTEGSEMLGLAVRLFAEIERGLKRQSDFRLVFEYVRDNTGATYTDAQRWCLGFVEGFSLFRELWTQDAHDTLHDLLDLVFNLAEMQGAPSPSYQELCGALPDVAEASYRYWQRVRDRVH